MDRYGGVHSQLICTSSPLGSPTCHQASQQENTYCTKYQKADRASTLLTLWAKPSGGAPPLLLFRSHAVLPMGQAFHPWLYQKRTPPPLNATPPPGHDLGSGKVHCTVFLHSAHPGTGTGTGTGPNPPTIQPEVYLGGDGERLGLPESYMVE